MRLKKEICFNKLNNKKYCESTGDEISECILRVGGGFVK